MNVFMRCEYGEEPKHGKLRRPLWTEGPREQRGVMRDGRWRYMAWRIQATGVRWIFEVTLEEAMQWAFDPRAQIGSKS